MKREIIITVSIFYLLFSCTNREKIGPNVFAPNTSYYINSYTTRIDSLDLESNIVINSDLSYDYQKANTTFGINSLGNIVEYSGYSDNNEFLKLSNKYGDTSNFGYSLNVAFPSSAIVDTIVRIEVYKDDENISNLFSITYKEANVKKDIKILDSTYKSHNNISETEKTMYQYSAIKYKEITLYEFGLKEHLLMSSFFILFSNYSLKGEFLIRMKMKNDSIVSLKVKP
jgi:hypothetical protein